MMCCGFYKSLHGQNFIGVNSGYSFGKLTYIGPPVTDHEFLIFKSFSNGGLNFNKRFSDWYTAKFQGSVFAKGGNSIFDEDSNDNFVRINYMSLRHISSIKKCLINQKIPKINRFALSFLVGARLDILMNYGRSSEVLPQYWDLNPWGYGLMNGLGIIYQFQRYGLILSAFHHVNFRPTADVTNIPGWQVRDVTFEANLSVVYQLSKD